MRASLTRLLHRKKRRLVCFNSHLSFADDSVAKSLPCSYLTRGLNRHGIMLLIVWEDSR